MGKCSIPRSNPGGGAERVGDIKVTTRSSLGDKWVLCNGDPKDGSESKIPDIKDEQCWTNVNGPYPTDVYAEGFHMDRAVYAGNGIWYSPDDNMGSYDLRIYKYDSNTGEEVGVYYRDLSDTAEGYAHLTFNGFTHLVYNKDCDTLAICYTNDSEYSDSDTVSYGLKVYIEIIDCKTYRSIHQSYFTLGEIANLFGADDAMGETVFNKNIKLIHSGNEVVLFLSFSTRQYNAGEYDTSDTDRYMGFVSADYDDFVSAGSPVWHVTPISEPYTKEPGCGLNGLYDFIEIGNRVYALILIPTGEWNYYTLACYEDTSEACIDLYSVLSRYGNTPSDPMICGSRLTTDGNNLYMLVNSEILSINFTTSSDITTNVYQIIQYRYDVEDGEYIGGLGYPEEGEVAQEFFYINGLFYIKTSADMVICDISSSEYADFENNGEVFDNYFNAIIVSSNEIAKSNCVFTSFTNGTDNCYWFNGNDTVERWPIITVDEEAYCFMKIKE